MVRPFPYPPTQNFHSLPVLSIGIFVSIVAVVTLCAKRGHKSSKSRLNNEQEDVKKTNNQDNKKLEHEDNNIMVGEDGLWQKNILMGEKCQPLEFSGVIYYDNNGHKISQIPRSPRACALSLHQSMSPRA